MSGLPAIICNEALREVLAMVTWERSDKFIRWVYPGALGRVNEEVGAEIEAGMLRGLSAMQIAREIYTAHS
jgi:hypothetical protein